MKTLNFNQMLEWLEKYISADYSKYVAENMPKEERSHVLSSFAWSLKLPEPARQD